MPYRIEMLEQDRVLLIQHQPDYDLMTHSAAMMEDTLAAINAAPGKVVVIIDASTHSITNMNEVMMVSKVARSETGKALLNHPKVLKSLVVTHNAVARLTMKGITSATFGFINTFLYETLEEALDDARIALNGRSMAS